MLGNAIPLSDVRNHLPGGWRPDLSTIWRWTLRGCRGVKLRTVLVGGRRFVETAALEEFIAALSAPAGAPVADPSFAARAAADTAELDRMLAGGE